MPKIPSHRQKPILDNIPWGRLSGVVLAYSAMGFFSAPWDWALAWVLAWGFALVLASASDWAGTSALALFMFFALLSNWAGAFVSDWALVSASDLAWNWFWSLASTLVLALASASALTSAWEELKKSFSKSHRLLILLVTSWLGLGLGWLVYQIFPIIGHR